MICLFRKRIKRIVILQIIVETLLVRVCYPDLEGVFAIRVIIHEYGGLVLPLSWQVKPEILRRILMPRRWPLEPNAILRLVEYLVVIAVVSLVEEVDTRSASLRVCELVVWLLF